MITGASLSPQSLDMTLWKSMLNLQSLEMTLWSSTLSPQSLELTLWTLTLNLHSLEMSWTPMGDLASSHVKTFIFAFVTYATLDDPCYRKKKSLHKLEDGEHTKLQATNECYRLFHHPSLYKLNVCTFGKALSIVLFYTWKCS